MGTRTVSVDVWIRAWCASRTLTPEHRSSRAKAEPIVFSFLGQLKVPVFLSRKSKYRRTNNLQKRPKDNHSGMVSGPLCSNLKELLLKLHPKVKGASFPFFYISASKGFLANSIKRPSSDPTYTNLIFLTTKSNRMAKCSTENHVPSSPSPFNKKKAPVLAVLFLKLLR